MSMQVSCVPQPPVVLPPSDTELMNAELTKINTLMQHVLGGTANESTYEGLKTAVQELNELILSVDNSNDFFKIGGFNTLMPLLSCPNYEVVAVTSELVADLCQNNTFCQAKILDFNLLPELVNLLDSPDAKIRSKSLYAISCLCRSNEDAVKHLEVTGIVPLLMKILEESDERLRAKAAFFLSYLANIESFREKFYQANMIKVLIKLLKDMEDSSTEHMWSALLAQVSQHKQSRIQSRQEDLNLKEFLHEKIRFYESKNEYLEAKEYCNRILYVCFHDVLKQS